MFNIDVKFSINNKNSLRELKIIIVKYSLSMPDDFRLNNRSTRIVDELFEIVNSEDRRPDFLHRTI